MGSFVGEFRSWPECSRLAGASTYASVVTARQRNAVCRRSNLMKFMGAFTHAGPAPSSLIALGPHNDCACASRPPAVTFKPPTHSCEDLKLRAQPSSAAGVATPLSAADHNVQALKPKAPTFRSGFSSGPRGAAASFLEISTGCRGFQNMRCISGRWRSPIIGSPTGRTLD